MSRSLPRTSRTKLKIIRHTDSDFKAKAALLLRRPIPSPKVERTVRKILEQVRKDGDEAVVRICNQFGTQQISESDIRLKRSPAAPSLPIRTALDASLSNIHAFSKVRIPKKWSKRNRQGATVGEAFAPIRRVGVYVPGGTAPLVSTALMTVALAQACGVPEIAACTPAPVNPTLHFALKRSGATEIYQIGGAQAIGALAYGTQTIAPVDKIFGPGNAYVVEAKRQVFGIVGIDLIPGPSEVAIVADDSAHPAYVASDLLAQAEHGPGSQIFLLTPSESFLTKVREEITKQLKLLHRQAYLKETLRKGCWLVHTRDLKQATSLAEDIAPEHLSLACRGARTLAKQMQNAGAIFIGNFSPVAMGDYMAGPSHTLPTGGAARAFPGLTAEQFMKRTSIVEYDRKSLAKSWNTLKILTNLEQMSAHQSSVGTRLSED